MPSRVDRRLLERVLRGLAGLALGALFLRTLLSPGATAGERRVVDGAALPRALADALEPASPALDLVLDTLPGVAERALARAIAGAGTPVSWRERPPAALPRLGVVAEPIADPDGRARVTVLGGGARTVALRDDAGALDSAQLSATGVRVLEALAGDAVHAALPGGRAWAVRRDSALLRPVLVAGRAGWEGKFVVAALEEAGWRVEARLLVAPGADVRQGERAPIDTARYAAVVALDASVASLAPAIARYVRSGGGLIALSDAAGIPALGALLPAAVGGNVAPIPGALLSPDPRRGLGGPALVRLTPHGVALDVDRGRVRVAAARAELGRVVLIGYQDTWRWRMEGDDAAPGAHRAWWSALVASVAHAPLVARPALADAAGDPAPFASLVEALGAPQDGTPGGAVMTAPWPWGAILLALFTAALLGEWASRRLRGAR